MKNHEKCLKCGSTSCEVKSIALPTKKLTGAKNFSWYILFKNMPELRLYRNVLGKSHWEGQKTQLKTTSKKIENIVDKVISTFKGIIFKNKDIISGRELVGGGIVSEETESRLLNLKKLRKLNNIYYIWDYNEEFKKLIFSYKYNRKKNLAKLIAGLIEEEFEYIIQKEK